jgi:hypothetical protein
MVWGVMPFAYSQKADPQDPRFKATTLASQFQVRVTDSRGRLVGGLQEQDFLILEKGTPRPIALFEERVQTGVGLAILVDVGSNMSEEAIRDAKQLTFDLVHLLDPEDEILTGIFGKDVHFLHELTTDRKLISEGLWNLPTGARPSRWKRLGNLWVSTANSGYAIDQALLKLKKTRHTDKVVLVVSAGFGNLGQATLDHLQLAGAQLLTVVIGNKLGDVFSLGGDQAARRRAVERTGGLNFAGETVLEEIDQLRLAIESYYLLGFSRYDPEGKAAITISIRGRPDYQVHAAPRTRSNSSFY